MKPQILGPPALFLLLSLAFLWQPVLTGKVFLPTDLSYRYDYLWKADESTLGFAAAQNPVLSDVAYYFYPGVNYAVARLRSGHFPLWNPYVLSGTPFFGTGQAGVLDPINLVAYLAGPLGYWTWAACLRMFVMGFATFGFLGALGRSRAAGMVAGAAFMACGYVAVWLNYDVVTTLTWVPVLFWASTRLLQTGQGVWVASTALAMGALLVGGHPETQFLAGLAWGAYCLFSLAAASRRTPRVSPWRGLVPLAGAAALGLVLASTQVLAFLEFLLRSDALSARAVGPEPLDLGSSAFRLAVLLSPNFGGTPLENNYWVQPFTNFNEQTGYAGLLTLALAAVGAAYWTRREPLALFFACAAILALLLTIRAPGYQFVKALPLFNVGHGIRWQAVWCFFLAVLAGYGMDALPALRADGRKLLYAGLGFAGAALLSLGALLVCYLGIRQANWDHIWGALLPHDKMLRLFHPAHLTLYWPAIFLGAGALVVLALYLGRLRVPAALALLVLLVYGELWAFGSRYNPVTPASAVYPRNLALDYLADHLGHERLAAETGLMVPNAASVFGFRDVRGRENVIDRAFSQLYGRLAAALDGSETKTVQLSLADHRLLQVAGVRYVLTAHKLRTQANPQPYRWVAGDDRVAIYENQQTLPRAYVVFSATVAPDIPSATGLLLSPSHDPSRAVVLVDSAVPLNGPSPGVSAAPVAWRLDEPEDVEVEATLPVPGYLVLSDNYAPGWEADVDGWPAPLLRANVAFRAVALPAGRHVVGFHYRPPLFYPSALAAALGMAIVLALAATHLRRDRLVKREE